MTTLKSLSRTIKGSCMVSMMLSENSWDLVAFFFTTLFYLPVHGDALSYLLAKVIIYGTVLSFWFLGIISFSHDHFLHLSFIVFSSRFPVYHLPILQLPSESFRFPSLYQKNNRLPVFCIFPGNGNRNNWSA